MKQMILTGLATEQSFESPTPKFFLVFNEGELRIEVDSEAAESVIAQMYSDNKTLNEEDKDDSINGHQYIPSSESYDEDDIDQV